MKHEETTDDFLNRLLNGEADEEVLSTLAARAESDGELAARLSDELEFSELVRQALRVDVEHSGEHFEADLASDDFSTDDLLERVREGSASRFECDRVVRHLWEHPDKVGDLRMKMAEDEWLREALVESKGEEAFVDSLATRMWAETRKDHFVADFTKRLDEEIASHAHEDEAENVVEFPESNRGLYWQMAGMAAAIIVAGFLTSLWFAGGMESRAESAASIVKSSRDVIWSGDLEPDLEGGLKPGRYQLDSGVVALKFRGGDEMTVEGPAVFDVNEDESAFVHAGVALARLSPDRKGISLQSNGLDIQEPASLMGINARSESSTEAVIFKGDGGVCMTDGGVCRELYEQEAIKADRNKDRLVDIPYNPHAFLKAWELLSGVEKNLGAVRIEMPGSEIGPSSSGQSEVQVFVENEAFEPEQDMEVDDVRPGEFASFETNAGQALQASGQLRSYLLQLWPSEGEDGEEVEASLTFDHEVVGVIYSSDRLANSDQSVGTTMTHAGEEFNRDRGLDSSGDLILLSEDRRTINLKLRGDGERVDQVRVLVALN